jgi:hypothetical protein
MTRLSCHRCPFQPSRAGAEPAGLQSGQVVATAGTAPTDRELVADQRAATAGEERRTAGQTCALLLAVPRGSPSESAAVRDDAGSDRAAAGTDGIADAGQARIGIGFLAGLG